MIDYKENKDKAGIYSIRNITNNKVYIGKTNKFSRRFATHKCALKRKCKKQENQHLINAWHKYGKENFTFEIIEIVDINSNFDSFLKERELFWMEFYKSTERKFGYNLRMDSSTKMIVHEETKKWQSENLKGNNNPNFGNKWTDEMKEKASIYLKEQFRSGERKINFIGCRKGIDNKLKLWEEKPELKDLMAKRVSDKRKYDIAQLDLNMNLLKIWTQVDLDNSEYYKPGILQLCNGNKKGKYKGFNWRYICRESGIIQEAKPTRIKNGLQKN